MAFNTKMGILLQWLFSFLLIDIHFMKIALLILLVIMNLMVLLEQFWQEGVPPFARIVNILFLVLSLAYFGWEIFKKGT